MSVTASIREQVRQRAHCACEFCGVTEIDTGGMLTIDHFRPRARAGSDELENLIYACISCNQSTDASKRAAKMATNAIKPSRSMSFAISKYSKCVIPQ